MSYADASLAGLQGPNINAPMGVLVVEMLRQFQEGRLTTHYIALDLDSFSLGAQPITDEWLESCV